MLRRSLRDREYAERLFKKRLDSHLQLARKSVPFYISRKGDYTGPIENWPTLSRHLLRQHENELINPLAQQNFSVNQRLSTGTTGEPARTHHSIFSLAYWQIQQWARWQSGCMGDRRRFFPWSSVVFLTTISDDHEYVVRCPGLNFCKGFKFNPVLTSLDQVLRQVRKLKPKYMAADPMVLEHFLANKNRKFNLPRWIVCSGAELQEGLKNEFEQTFGVKVARDYKSSEFELIGFECSHGRGYHYFDVSSHIEILDPQSDRVLSDGEVGEIAITSLRNVVQPLFRYRMGDMGVIDKGPCECGLSLPRIRDLRGRSSVQFISGDGQSINPSFLFDKFQDLPVLKWQVIQLEFDKFKVNFKYLQTTGRDQISLIENRTRQVLEELMSRSLSIEFGVLEDAKLTKKFNSIVSEVNFRHRFRNKS